MGSGALSDSICHHARVTSHQMRLRGHGEDYIRTWQGFDFDRASLFSISILQKPVPEIQFLWHPFLYQCLKSLLIIFLMETYSHQVRFLQAGRWCHGCQRTLSPGKGKYRGLSMSHSFALLFNLLFSHLKRSSHFASATVGAPLTGGTLITWTTKTETVPSSILILLSQPQQHFSP